MLLQDHWLNFEASQLRPAALSGAPGDALAALAAGLQDSSSSFLTGPSLTLADVSVDSGKAARLGGRGCSCAMRTVMRAAVRVRKLMPPLPAWPAMLYRCVSTARCCR